MKPFSFAAAVIAVSVLHAQSWASTSPGVAPPSTSPRLIPAGPTPGPNPGAKPPGISPPAVTPPTISPPAVLGVADESGRWFRLDSITAKSYRKLSAKKGCLEAQGTLDDVPALKVFEAQACLSLIELRARK